MIKLIAKLKTNPKAYKLEVHGRLELPYAERQLQGEVLRSGDLATSDEGRVYEVIAQAEKLLHIDCPQSKEAAIVGYLLGNGHVPVQVGKGFMRVVLQPAIEEMMRQLGINASPVEAPFEPDFAPPGGGHHHHHGHDHDH